MQKFKKDDTVFSYRRQKWGTVCNNKNVDADKYPLFVKFDDNDYDTYTEDGKFSRHDVVQDIFFNEVTIVPPPRPLQTLQVDDKVKVWNGKDGYKDKRHFSHFNGNGRIYVFANGGTSWTSTGTVRYDNWELPNEESE